MKAGKTLVAVAFMALLTQCETATPTPPVNGGSGGTSVLLTDTSITNKPYLAQGASSQQVLDFSLPANRSDTTRMVIIVHGGGWSAGDKGELAWLQAGMKQRGFATANINYRLANNTSDNYKMKLDDVDSAVNFVMRNAAVLTYSASKIYIVGHSAGAHLSLCEAYSRNGNRKLKAVGSMAGPTDLFSAAYYNAAMLNGVLEPFLGMPLYPITQTSTDRYKSTSPRYQATATAVPSIFFHGYSDPLVGYDQSQIMYSYLQSIGVRSQAVYYTLTFHDWWTDGVKTADTMDKLSDWFKSSN